MDRWDYRKEFSWPSPARAARDVFQPATPPRDDLRSPTHEPATENLPSLKIRQTQKFLRAKIAGLKIYPAMASRKGKTRLRASSVFCLHKFYGCRINAKTLARGAWPVRKYMAEVGVALAAKDLFASHSVAHVAVDLNALVIDGSVKTRPTRAGMKFRLRSEQRLPAANAHIHSGFFRVFVLTGSGRFRAFLAGHVILLGS